MAAVTANHQFGANRKRAVRRFGAYADDPTVFLNQLFGLGPHPQIESLVAAAVLGQEIEKIPLRHHGNEFAVRRQMAKIRHRNAFVTDLSAELLDLLVRQFEEFVEQAQLIHQLKRRRMYGIAAKIAEEIGVLFQHDDLDPGPRQEETEHHPGRPAAGDDAFCGN